MPNYLQINTCIIVNNSIAKASDSMPIDILIFVSKLLGHLICCFPYNLEISYNSIYSFVIFTKCIKSESVGIF